MLTDQLYERDMKIGEKRIGRNRLVKREYCTFHNSLLKMDASITYHLIKSPTIAADWARLHMEVERAKG